MIRTSVILAWIFLVLSSQVLAQPGPSSFEFIENKGQWNNSVTFKGELSSGAFFLQKKGFTISLHHPEDLSLFMGSHQHEEGGTKKNKKFDYSKDLSGKLDNRNLGSPRSKIRSHAYAVEFVGANENPQVTAEKPLQTFNNYFIGNDPSKWVSNAKIFQAVLYKNVYPNIDIRYYSENQKLKYDIIVHPGGDPAKIVMKYSGAEKLSIKNNELIIKTSVGDVKELYPYSFQSDNLKGRKKIECRYVLASNNTVKFELGQYSRNTALVIDPSLIFVSFTGSSANQYGFTATPGPDGSLFSGGIVFEPGFPVTPGAYQSDFQGGTDDGLGTDIGIMKFSPNGSQRLYATYIGGSHNDYPHSLYSDPQGNLVVLGRSYSPNYPGTKVGPTGGGDIIVTKLNASGTAIIGSLMIGGSQLDGVNIEDIQRSRNYSHSTLIRNYGDDSRSEVILDGSSNIYVAAQTQSSDFPRVGGFQASLGGKQDGVVMKINPTCTGVLWASFLGGTGDDGAFVLDINPADGNIYVGGGTTTGAAATDGPFPGIAAGPMGSGYRGGQTDAFVSIITNNGSTLVKSVYLGTGNSDVIYGLKFDRVGFPYIMGVSRGGQWPVSNAAFSNAGSSQFVAKLQPDLSAFEYSTVFGSGSSRPNMSPVAFLVDRCENLYISGWGGWINSGNGTDPFDQAGVAGMQTTADAVKRTTDNRDFYFIVIQKNASSLLYGSFFGQTGGQTGEHVDGGTSRFDQQGVIYQAICANCGGGAQFPTTPGVVGPVNGAPGNCNLAAVKMAFNFAGVAAGPRPTVNGVRDSLGCAPFTVTLQDTVRNAVSYEWRFGDGSPDSVTNAPVSEVTHVYNTVGTYTVRLIAIDTNSCNERDTAYTTVVVGQDRANLSMTIDKLEPCEELNYQFNNTSTITPGARPFNDSSFVWDFGDGTAPVYTGTGAITHSYAQPGIYNVRFFLVDPSYCNSPDSIVRQVFVNPLVDARFETPLGGCAPYDAVFTNISLAGQTFEWNFGDGSPISTDVNPTHLYTQPGTYTISLTARDPGTCNLVDDTSITITVSNRPTAEFSHTPVVPVQNTPTIFTNLSTDGVRYKWLFGDGDSVVKTTRDTVLHQYNATGTFNACLITYNQFDCTDTVCHEVQADILPLLDVPNAFTPGKFGRNSTIRVEGFGIARMTWTIYNRWGQMVFQTNDRKIGWDGTSKGQPLPMDVYQYTLDVQFVDGATRRRTGDITLIR